MKMIKTILGIILATIISICAFGGGCLIWVLIAIFLQPSPLINEIMFYASALIPIPFCWYIAPKIGDKIL